jgi:hypothetical protein
MSKDNLTEEQKTEYFRRSYTAVDGLWFMKIEEGLGFDFALKIDEAVWSILPKIQARTLKSMMDLNDGIDDLMKALSTRFVLEGYDFLMQRKEDGLMITVFGCPWHQAMVKSGREGLSERVSNVICRVENETWAREFSPAGKKVDNADCSEVIEFGRESRLCRGEGKCRLWFERKGKN